MKITYWSDYACPYCYIGETRLKRAIEELGAAGEIELEPRAFELDPGAPKTVGSDTPSRFSRKYGIPLEAARRQVEHISGLGRAEGIDFRYATTQYTNTFDAHRLMKLALSTGSREVAEKTNHLLFDAYFTRNLKLAEENTLVEIGEAAGLDGEEVRSMLASRRFADDVRADEQAAAAQGVRGVPYFLFPNGVTIPGSMSVKDFKDVVAQALAGEAAKKAGRASSCGANGCALNR